MKTTLNTEENTYYVYTEGMATTATAVVASLLPSSTFTFQGLNNVNVNLLEQ